jgi:hypothetical protein
MTLADLVLLASGKCLLIHVQILLVLIEVLVCEEINHMNAEEEGHPEQTREDMRAATPFGTSATFRPGIDFAREVKILGTIYPRTPNMAVQLFLILPFC